MKEGAMTPEPIHAVRTCSGESKMKFWKCSDYV
jgi:hypothetical protein